MTLKEIGTYELEMMLGELDSEGEDKNLCREIRKELRTRVDAMRPSKYTNKVSNWEA